MKKYLSMLLIVMVTSGCSTMSDSSLTEKNTSFQIEALEKDLDDLMEQNNRLENEMNALKEEHKEKLKEYTDESEMLRNEIFAMEESMKLMYRDANAYRNDVKDIFNALNQIEAYKFVDLDKLNSKQKKAIIKGIKQYAEEAFYVEEGDLDNIEFIGEKPSQLTIFNVLAIRPSTPKFYESDNDVIHLEYVFYLTSIPVNTEAKYKDLYYQLRNFYDGLNVHHIVIEKIDGQWECVYIGIG